MKGCFKDKYSRDIQWGDHVILMGSVLDPNIEARWRVVNFTEDSVIVRHLSGEHQLDRLPQNIIVIS